MRFSRIKFKAIKLSRLCNKLRSRMTFLKQNFKSSNLIFHHYRPMYLKNKQLLHHNNSMSTRVIGVSSCLAMKMTINFQVLVTIYHLLKMNIKCPLLNKTNSNKIYSICLNVNSKSKKVIWIEIHLQTSLQGKTMSRGRKKSSKMSQNVFRETIKTYQ